MRQPETPISILCSGRFYCDLIFTGAPQLPAMGEEIYATGLSLVPGGGAFISAAWIQAQGHRASLLSWLPAGPFGAAIQKDIERSGVDTQLCDTHSEQDAPQLTAAIAIGSERALLTRRTGPAVPPVETAIANSDAQHLHIGELATLVEHPELVPLARQSGMSVSLDCSWDEDVFKRGDLMPLISSVDVFLPNAKEADKLSISTTGPSPCPLTVIKQGAEGATAINGVEILARSARKTQVIDSTGAGDAFNAGFLISWLQNKSLGACLDNAVQSGSEATVCIGGLPE